jgi:hypothetical protein
MSIIRTLLVLGAVAIAVLADCQGAICGSVTTPLLSVSPPAHTPFALLPDVVTRLTHSAAACCTPGLDDCGKDANGNSICVDVHAAIPVVEVSPTVTKSEEFKLNETPASVVSVIPSSLLAVNGSMTTAAAISMTAAPVTYPVVNGTTMVSSNSTTVITSTVVQVNATQTYSIPPTSTSESESFTSHDVSHPTRSVTPSAYPGAAASLVPAAGLGLLVAAVLGAAF